MSQVPEYQQQDFYLPVCPTVEQQLEKTVRQYEATVADIVRRLGGTQESDAFICPFCKGYFDRTAAASSSCNHPSPLGPQRRPIGNTGNYPGHANSHQLDEVLRTVSPNMRQYVMSLEEAYQQKMKESGTDENAALQNLQQRMLNMANSQPNSPRFSRNPSNPPRPATSIVGDGMVNVGSVVPGNTGDQIQVNSRNDPSPRKSGGIWAALRRK